MLTLTLAQFIAEGYHPNVNNSVWLHSGTLRCQLLAIMPACDQRCTYNLLTYQPDTGSITTYHIPFPDDIILNIYPVQEELDLR